jgi:SAM-dependent methyltransferase
MDANEYGVMYQAEQSHWWYLGMADITRAILRTHVNPNKMINILDAGCGTGGAMATILTEFGYVTGFDISSLGLEYCRKRNLKHLAQASVCKIPFPSECFDLVTSLDVLYEQGVINDEQAMKELYRVLTPGGTLLVRLPAYDWLRGRHDRVIHTRQRYGLGEVKKLLSSCGFRVQIASHANMLLFFPAMVKRLGERIAPGKSRHSDLEIPVGKWNGLLRSILSMEARYISSPGLPFGLSVIAVGQKIP